VESLDRAFENVCELDLVFHFDEVSHRPIVRQRCVSTILEVHHILAEVVQGGLVLETNVEEIASASESSQTIYLCDLKGTTWTCSSGQDSCAEGVLCCCQPSIPWCRARLSRSELTNTPRVAHREDHWSGRTVIPLVRVVLLLRHLACRSSMRSLASDYTY
jgi:hypothetical protein